MDEADKRRLKMDGTDGLTEAMQKIADCSWQQRCQFPPETADAGQLMALATTTAACCKSLGYDEEVYRLIMAGGWKRMGKTVMLRQPRPHPKKEEG